MKTLLFLLLLVTVSSAQDGPRDFFEKVANGFLAVGEAIVNFFKGPLPESVVLKTVVVYDKSVLENYKGDHEKIRAWFDQLIPRTKEVMSKLDTSVILEVAAIEYLNKTMSGREGKVPKDQRPAKERIHLSYFVNALHSTDGSKLNGWAMTGSACETNGDAVNFNAMFPEVGMSVRVWAHEIGHTLGLR